MHVLVYDFLGNFETIFFFFFGGGGGGEGKTSKKFKFRFF